MKATNLNISLEMCNIPADTLFRFLEKNDWEELMANRKCFQYQKGDCIILEGHRVNGFFCISTGVVKLSKAGVGGKEQIIKLLKSGDVFGYQSVLSEHLPSVSAYALAECGVCFVPTEVLFHLIKKNQKFSAEILKLACHEQDEMIGLLMGIAQRTVKERLAEKLLSIERCFGTDSKGFLNLALSREEYANFVGTATETIIRLLADFKQNGWIEIYKRKIKIIDEKQLLTISKSIE